MFDLFYRNQTNYSAGTWCSRTVCHHTPVMALYHRKSKTSVVSPVFSTKHLCCNFCSGAIGSIRKACNNGITIRSTITKNSNKTVRLSLIRCVNNILCGLNGELTTPIAAIPFISSIAFFSSVPQLAL